MIAGQTDSLSGTSLIAAKAAAYWELLKFRLSFLVAFSCAFGYVLASAQVNWVTLAMLFVGGLLLSGGSSTINQILEKDLDKVMTRTMTRPLPTQRLTVQEAIVFAVICLAAGTLILLRFTNLLTVLLSLLSMVLYSFVYTPLKRVGPVAVFVGAIPGALPPLLGWTAATGAVSYEALIIFGIQFIWQFPHFWAIAWIAHKDYTAAGFKLLPSNEGPTKYSAIQAIIYSLLLLPVGILPYFTGMSGLVSMVVVLIANLFMVGMCVRLYREMTVKAARRVMFGSYIYLPVVLLALLANKTA